MANANIFQQYLAPPKSVLDYRNELDRADANQLTLQNQRGVNALQALTAQQTQATMADATAKRNAIQAVYAANPTADPLTRARALQNNPLTADVGLAAEKALLENGKTIAETGEKTQNAASKKQADMLAMHDKHLQELQGVSTPQEFMQWINSGVGSNLLDLQKAAGLAQTLQQDPSQFPALKKRMLDTGKSIIDTFKQEQENARNAATVGATTRGQDIGAQTAAAARAQADRHFGATQAAANQGVTYQTNPDTGEMVALPTKVAPGATPVAGRTVSLDGVPLKGKGLATGTKIADAKDVISLLDQAEPLLNDATSSYLGKARDQTARAFGASTDGAQSAAQLRALEGALISKMPKMSGPQSDKDVLLYKQMAGQIGDDTIPAATKRAAMKTIREIAERNAGSTGGASGNFSAGTRPSLDSFNRGK